MTSDKTSPSPWKALESFIVVSFSLMWSLADIHWSKVITAKFSELKCAVLASEHNCLSKCLRADVIVKQCM